MTEHTADLVVVGSGPAGMAAASEAVSLGLSVSVLDEQLEIGGQIYRRVEKAPRNLLGILGPDYSAGKRLADEFRKSGSNYIGEPRYGM